MTAYLITGVSRGLGFEFIKQLSGPSANIVIGLVRDKASTDAKIRSELGFLKNVHILQADIADYRSLKNCVSEVSRITGGKLDFIFANAAYVSTWSAYSGIGDLGAHPEDLEKDLLSSFTTNVIGNIHLFNLFMPLVLKGTAKKVITLSTGMADLDLVNNFSIKISAPYAISKAAMNLAVAKFNAQYKQYGVLFLSISPGLVETGQIEDEATDEQKQETAAMAAAFSAYAPHFTGPTTPQSGVRDVLGIVNGASVENGQGGAFLSHLGNKQWL